MFPADAKNPLLQYIEYYRQWKVFSGSVLGKHTVCHSWLPSATRKTDNFTFP